MFLIIIIPLFILTSIFIQSFFANSEMAIVSSNRIHLKYLSKKGNKKANIVLNLLNNPDRLFATTLLSIQVY